MWVLWKWNTVLLIAISAGDPLPVGNDWLANPQVPNDIIQEAVSLSPLNHLLPCFFPSFYLKYLPNIDGLPYWQNRKALVWKCQCLAWKDLLKMLGTDFLVAVLLLTLHLRKNWKALGIEICFEQTYLDDMVDQWHWESSHSKENRGIQWYDEWLLRNSFENFRDHSWIPHKNVVKLKYKAENGFTGAWKY